MEKKSLSAIGTEKVEWFYHNGNSEVWNKVAGIENYKNFLLTKHDQREHIVEIWGNDQLIWRKEGTNPIVRKTGTQIVTEMDVILADLIAERNKPITSFFDSLTEEFAIQLGNVWYKPVVLEQFEKAKQKTMQKYVEQKLF